MDSYSYDFIFSTFKKYRQEDLIVLQKKENEIGSFNVGRGQGLC